MWGLEDFLWGCGSDGETRVEVSGGTRAARAEWDYFRSEWRGTRLGNSSGGSTIFVVKVGVNSAETIGVGSFTETGDGQDSGRTS